MSIRIMTQVWESAQKTATHKLILLAFADHANDDGLCWPSIDTISNKSQLSHRQTQRIIHDLIGDNLLKVVDKHTQHRTPTYEVRGDNLTPLELSGVTSETPEVTSTTPEVTSEPSEVTPMSPKPSVTVIKEPSEEPPLSLKEIRLRENYANSQKRVGRPRRAS